MSTPRQPSGPWPVILMILRGEFNSTNGLANVLCRLSQKLSRMGGKVVFLAYEGVVYPEGLAMVRSCGGEIWTAAGPGVSGKRLAGLSALVKAAYGISKIIKPDLIVGQYSRAGNAVAIAGRLLNIPSIRVARFGPVQYDSLVRRLADRFRRRVHGLLGNLATTTIAVSAATAAYEVSCGIDARKVKVIYNSMSPETVEITHSRAHVRDELKIPQEAPVLLIGAYLVLLKGHAYLFNALAKMGEAMPYLVVAGDGPLADELKKLVLELGLQARVSFIGRRSDMGNILNASDCVVLPSIGGEALPRILLEAMVVSRPVIATRVAGIPELVKDGETGKLVEPRNVEELETAIRDFVQHRDKWRDMGIAGSAHLRANFDLDTKLQEEIDLYLATIAAK